MADLAAFLTAKYFPKSGESLVFGSFPVNQLVEIYGTPMFVYVCSVLDLKYNGCVPFRCSGTLRYLLLHQSQSFPWRSDCPRKRSRSIGALRILAGIRNPGATARNTSSFARTLEITYPRRSIKTRALGNICYRISVAKMGTAASDGL
jgi:hypothetical protein